MTARVGREEQLSFTVGDEDTAAALGSGDVPVLATPRMLAWMEAATVAAVAGDIDPTASTVGTRAELDHLLPSPVGAQVTVRAQVVSVDGRSVRFEVVAQHGEGRVVAHGKVVRVVVDRARFLSRGAG